MKSSSWRRALPWLVALAAAWLISHERGGLVSRFGQVKRKSDAFLLPNPDQTYLASLGYRSAMADLVFGHVLVSYGLHFQENRWFEHVGHYLDVINRLDPKFRDPYRFADTLLTVQPVEPPAESYRKARRILERGMAELPYDQELWATAGQFMAYLAPSRLSDPKEQAEFRDAGAKALMRACDLVGSNEAIPYHCITAANLLNQNGKREAMVSFLERLLSVTDNPKIQELALGYLKREMGEKRQAEVAARQERFLQKWRTDLPFVPRVEIDALGPAFDAAACAGPRRDASACRTSWSEWAADRDAAGTP